MMNKLLFLVLAGALHLAQGAPAPVDLQDDVELVKPINTNTRVFTSGSIDGLDDQTDFFDTPVLVVHRRFPLIQSSFGFPFFGTNLFQQSVVPLPDIDSFDLFGNVSSPDYDVASFNRSACGFFCQFFRQFDDQVKDLGVFKNQHKDKFNQAASTTDGHGFDVFNKTYDEKVLPDGSVVKVNRTLIADSGKDGSFFFHSTSLHNVAPSVGQRNTAVAATSQKDDAPEVELFTELVPRFQDAGLNEIHNLKFVSNSDSATE